MTFHIVTLFPDAFRSYLGESILKRAIEDKKIVVKFYNPRDFADNKYKRIDRAPYGGRPGMVIQALPVIKAIEDALETCNAKHVTRRKKEKISYGLRVTGYRRKSSGYLRTAINLRTPSQENSPAKNKT